MTAETTPSTLASLPAISYLDETGQIPLDHEGQVGVYAILDKNQTLQYVGYSRNIYLSLKQHLIRQPQACYWYKTQTINRPSRSVLEGIQSAWIAENEAIPVGNGSNKEAWTSAIDAKVTMTEEEKFSYQQLEEIAQIKFLKKLSRRLEADIKTSLEDRGVRMDFRFNPKLKEKGLLDLK